jgi:hypothetical protein
MAEARRKIAALIIAVLVATAGIFAVAFMFTATEVHAGYPAELIWAPTYD